MKLLSLLAPTALLLATAAAGPVYDPLIDIQAREAAPQGQSGKREALPQGQAWKREAQGQGWTREPEVEAFPQAQSRKRDPAPQGQSW